MPVPTTITDLSATASSNSPSGSDAIGTSLDDYIRAIQSILKRVTTGADAMTTPALGTPASGVATNLTGTAAALTAGYANAGPSGSAFSFRNKIINGDMRVIQRGSATLSGTAQYAEVDRWMAVCTGTGVSGTLQQRGVLLVSSSRYSFGMNSFSCTSGIPSFQQRIESKNVFDLNSKTITVQVKVYHDFGVTTNFTVEVGKATALDNFTSVTSVGTFTGDCSSGTTTTLTGQITLGASDATNGIYVKISPTSAATYTSKNFSIGDVQLEAGSVATPFESRPYGTELALCQRYYEIINLDNISPGIAGLASSTTVPLAGVRFAVEKRVAPTTITLPTAGQTASTISFTNGSGTYPTTTGTHSTSSATTHGFRLIGAAYSGLTLGQATNLFSSGATQIKIEAEL